MKPGLVLLIVLMTAGIVATQESPEPRVRILSPTPDSFLSGPVLLQAEIVPASQARLVAEVSFFADEGYVETHGMLGELRHTAEALGIEVRRDSRVTGIATPGDRARGVELETGELLPADVVVCAAGRWTGEVAALAGASVPLLGPEDARVAGFLATTTRTATSLSRSVFSPRLNLRPDGGGKLVLQAFDLDADAFADAVDGGAAGVAVELAHRLEEILRLPAAVDVEELRVGVRALPVDGFPIVGWAEGVEGVYVVASHSGVTLSSTSASRRLRKAVRPYTAASAAMARRSFGSRSLRRSAALTIVPPCPSKGSTMPQTGPAPPEPQVRLGWPTTRPRSRRHNV